jgi:hypothetical protein
MVTNPKDTAARKSIGKFARTLLATTCLSAASGGAALAGTISYGPGAPANYSATFAGALTTPLSAATIPGTTNVSGQVTSEDNVDFFELTGLGTGTFTLTATALGEVGEAAVTLSEFVETVTVFTDGDTTLEGPTAFDFGDMASFASMSIPTDGNLVVEVEQNFESSANYTVTVNTTAPTATVPEPSTIATVGLGLAGALTLRRRRRQQ